MLPCLARVKPVAKSAYAGPQERPSAEEHYESLRVTPDLLVGPSITLVDDVITRGRTALAAACRIQEAFPQSVVRVFAFVRTMSFVEDVDRVREPVQGCITWNGADARRSP